LNAGAHILRLEVCRKPVPRPGGKGRWLFLAAFFLWVIAGRAEPGVTVAPVSPWITLLTFQRLTRLEDLTSGESRLLLRDVQINARTQETFHHEARQLLAREGVQNGSHISVDFNPGRQSLVLHWVKIWRGLNTFDKLNLENVKVIEPERALEQYLFTGEKRALLLLDDVRAGDIVDYAYTIRGDDPAENSNMREAIPLREYEPVEHLATRLLWPEGRPLYLKNHGADAKPFTVKKDGMTEFIWDYKKVPGLKLEDSLPTWYDPLPWVQWSEFQKWPDVIKWELTIFTNSTPLSPELARQIKEWRALPAAEDRVLAVLRFVQDEVRYQGIETGAEAFTPADPSLVFARRFGDCKDKTMLCVTVLRALGIEACPVLVSTTWRKTIEDWQPTATAFDHAIVQVTVDGQHYFLDPTVGFERGPLAARSWPDYGRGLVLDPKATGLTVIRDCPVQPRTTVLEYAVVRILPLPTNLKIITIADGADADAMRRRLATTTPSEMENDNLNAFAALYPGITRSAPLEHTDDEKANEIVVTDYYQIANFWSALPTGPGYICRFYSFNVDRAVKKPLVSFRSMPLALKYPEHQVFRAEITLPLSNPVAPGTWAVNNPAFHFHKTVLRSGGKVLLEQEYDTLADSVPVDALPNYLSQLDQASDLLGYSLFSY
jgi:transglutaminase-like putative cysteine protease